MLTLILLLLACTVVAGVLFRQEAEMKRLKDYTRGVEVMANNSLDDLIHPGLASEEGSGYIIKKNKQGFYYATRGGYSKIHDEYEYMFIEYNTREKELVGYDDIYINSWVAQIVCDIMNLEVITNLEKRMEDKRNESVRTTSKRKSR